MRSRWWLGWLLATGSCTSQHAEPDASPLADSPIDASPSCLEATSHSDLAFIEDRIFRVGCTFQACHDGVGTTGTLDLRASMSHAALVDVDAGTDALASPPGSYKLVVPNQPRQSYLLFTLRHYSGPEMVPPAGEPDPDVGYMPQDTTGLLPPLCVEKREAIVRWIEAGAPPRSL